MEKIQMEVPFPIDTTKTYYAVLAHLTVESGLLPPVNEVELVEIYGTLMEAERACEQFEGDGYRWEVGRFLHSLEVVEATLSPTVKVD